MLLKELNKGDVFYEYAMGENIKLVALDDPKEDPNRKGFWTLPARSCYGEIQLAQDEQYKHYGPRLSKAPEYH